MKLSELLFENDNIFDLENVKKLTGPEFHHILARAELGSGFYNKVYVADQYSVNKVICNVNNPTSNGYLRYINEVLKAGSNPYLPQVYNVSMYAGDSETDFLKCYVVQLERLISAKDISKEETLQLLERTIGHRLTTKEIAEINTYAKVWGNEYITDNPYFEYLTRFIEAVISGKHERESMNKTIKNLHGSGAMFIDSQLKNAMRLMKKFKKNANLHVDIKLDNIMFRRSPTGLQMVFTDPFHDW